MAKSARINAKPRAKATPQTFIQRSRNVGAGAKAFYHNVSGAGGKVVRAFLGLTKDEQQEIKRLLVKGMEGELRRQSGRG